jgi:putative transposase
MNEYNDRPHRALPRVRGEDGRLRHMSPNEAWAQAVADGFRPVEIDRDEARDLWWPQKAVKCIRGELRLFGKTNFNVGLAEYHDEVLRVAYDIGDAQQVIVRDLKGRFLCEAQLEGNLRDYFAESVLAEAARKRAEGRLRRLDAKREEVEQELHGSRVIEHAPSPTFDWAAVDTTPQSVAMERDQSWESERAKDLGSQSQSVSAAQAATSEVSPNGDQPLTDFAVTASTACSRGEKPDGPSQQTPPVARPFFTWSRDRYEWLMQHRDQWLEQDRAFLQHYVSSEDYALLREMFEAEGIAWREKDGPNEAAG